MSDNNVIIIDRIKGVPAKEGTPESDQDPRNPNVPPEFAALGITEGESVVIPRAQYDALMAAAKALMAYFDDRPYIAREIAALRAAGIHTEDN